MAACNYIVFRHGTATTGRNDSIKQLISLCSILSCT